MSSTLTKRFRVFRPRAGDDLWLSRLDGRTSLAFATTQREYELGPGETLFAFASGPTGINLAPAEFCGRVARTSLDPGEYAALPTNEIGGKSTAYIYPGGPGVLLIFAHGYRAQPIGKAGPIEPRGRLRYIDGCTDSLLIPPVKKGDPCLNHLHFPPGIDQTMHTHPSIRVGMVARGRGVCITPLESFSLEPGSVFVLPADAEHKFRTEASSMDVIAYHPDSDWGPEDQFHPMINRTIVDGVSASELESIRTR